VRGEPLGARLRHPSRWSLALAALVAVVVLDQLTKSLVRARVSPGDSDAVFPFLDVVRVRNTGVAFGLLSGGGVVVVVLAVAALALLVAYFARHPEKPGLWVPTGLLLGGAAGNAIDRIRLGAVTDFLKLPHWPAFNVADVAITVGVLALVYVMEGPRPSPRARHG
jgi:signal peptidase II